MPKAIMSQNFNKITPDITKVTSTYLEHCMNSLFVQNQFKQNITDTVRTFLSLTKIKEVKIPLPPIREQKKFENIIRATQKRRSRLDYVQAVSNELFSALSQQAFNGELTKTKAA